ncbi:MAG TPA: hypothetical protein VHE14_05145 [Solirubrobacteraceae bacterium]|nr:hypothetical protein [Solirubrobacteraceae bacterium]
MACERGQATVEWAALLLVVASVLSVGATATAIDASWLPRRLRCAIFDQSCREPVAAFAPAPPADARAAAADARAPAADGAADPLPPAGATMAGVRGAFRPIRAHTAGLMHWVPGLNFKSDLSQKQARKLAHQLRDQALNLAIAGFLIGVGGSKAIAEKLIAEVVAGLSELSGVELSRMGDQVAEAVTDAKRGQRICVHIGLKGPSILGIPAIPSPLAVPALTAYPRHGKRC